ncbi:MAG: nitroreductase family protein [Thermoplasmata archaeon]|nr:nitroreductase family protein [Thermoplasmata archaeon]
MSIRKFNNETITDEQLATILWNAAGYRQDGNRTIADINGTYASVIYVLKEDAAYTYNPVNHSLQFYKPGDWRDTVGYQYPGAPLVLGLCYNTTLTNPNNAAAEIGEICQNIAFTVDALNLGTVVIGGFPPAIDKMGIPEDQTGLIIMLLGHLLHPYNFKYRLLWFSLLPKVIETQMNLTTALQQRTQTTNFQGTITRQELSQLIWSSYGFSYYLDKSNQDLNQVKRHRTVPSAQAYYPLEIYAVTASGVYKYQPNLLTMFGNYSADFIGLPVVTYLQKIRNGDNRASLAAASSLPSISSVPLSIITVLNWNKTKNTGEQYLQFWYFEAGAAAQNIMLEAAALGFKSNIVLPTDNTTLSSLLKLTDGYTPLLIVPVGT